MQLPDAADRLRIAPVKALRAVFAGVGQLLLAADRFRAEAEEAGVPDAYDPLRSWPPEPGQQPAAEPDLAAATASAATATAAESEAGGRIGKPHREKSARNTKPPAKSRQNAKVGVSDARADASGAGDSAIDGDGTTMRAGKAKRSGQAAQPRRFRSLDSTGNVRVLTAADLASMSPADGQADRQADRQAAARPDTAELAPPDTTELAPPDAAEPAPPDIAGLPVPGYDQMSLPALRARLRGLDAEQVRVLLDYERSNLARTDVVGMFERRIGKLTGTAIDAT